MPESTQKNIHETALLAARDVDLDNDRKADGFRIEIRQQLSIGSLRLRAIGNIDVFVDGKKIDPENIVFEVRKQRFSLSSLKTISDIWWIVGETAHIEIIKKGGLGPGKHEIRVDVMGQKLCLEVTQP